jgi:hypothetical protein
MRKIIAAVLVAGAMTVSVSATAATPDRWSRFNATRTTSQVVRIVVKTQCLNAEDSAAHLRLISYGGGRAVYGCSRRGY